MSMTSPEFEAAVVGVARVLSSSLFYLGSTVVVS
jgi:hypothetical protein